jgi:hypothetical protein
MVEVNRVIGTMSTAELYARSEALKFIITAAQEYLLAGNQYLNPLKFYHMMHLYAESLTGTDESRGRTYSIKNVVRKLASEGLLTEGTIDHASALLRDASVNTGDSRVTVEDVRQSFAATQRDDHLYETGDGHLDDPCPLAQQILLSMDRFCTRGVLHPQVASCAFRMMVAIQSAYTRGVAGETPVRAVHALVARLLARELITPAEATVTAFSQPFNYLSHRLGTHEDTALAVALRIITSHHVLTDATLFSSGELDELLDTGIDAHVPVLVAAKMIRTPDPLPSSNIKVHDLHVLYS